VIAPRSCRTAVCVRLGATRGQSDSGYRDPARDQGAGNDPLQGVDRVHDVEAATHRLPDFRQILAKFLRSPDNRSGRRIAQAETVDERDQGVHPSFVGPARPGRTVDERAEVLQTVCGCDENGGKVVGVDGLG
jgi:hypothetical protein